MYKFFLELTHTHTAISYVLYLSTDGPNSTKFGMMMHLSTLRIQVARRRTAANRKQAVSQKSLDRFSNSNRLSRSKLFSGVKHFEHVWDAEA